VEGDEGMDCAANMVRCDGGFGVGGWRLRVERDGSAVRM
jgi:hypothetical protein